MSDSSTPSPDTPTLSDSVLEEKAVLKLSTVIQILKCLETAQTRSAFKANEMSFVGRLYDGLSSFVQKKIEEDRKKTSETTGTNLKTVVEENPVAEEETAEVIN